MKYKILLSTIFLASSINLASAVEINVKCDPMMDKDPANATFIKKCCSSIEDFANDQVKNVESSAKNILQKIRSPIKKLVDRLDTKLSQKLLPKKLKDGLNRIADATEIDNKIANAAKELLRERIWSMNLPDKLDDVRDDIRQKLENIAFSSDRIDKIVNNSVNNISQRICAKITPDNLEQMLSQARKEILGS